MKQKILGILEYYDNVVRMENEIFLFVTTLSCSEYNKKDVKQFVFRYKDFSLHITESKYYTFIGKKWINVMEFIHAKINILSTTFQTYEQSYEWKLLVSECKNFVNNIMGETKTVDYRNILIENLKKNKWMKQ